jgi:serine/threonine-protein kinase
MVEACERTHPLLDGSASERFAALFDDPPATFPDALSDRYRLTRELGRGGMATVFLARDLKHERDVAVKVMRPELALGRERFLREIAIAARLRHPHIVPLFDSGDAGGVLYYVMPYEDGQSLRTRLAREGPLPVADALAILRDVCDALIHAHAQGIVHRDIKPDNVLMSGTRNAMVTDFGVARAVHEASDRGLLNTGGIAIGTPAYMAPEQVAGDPGIDHRADIYSVGVLAYELFAGGPPFTADTPQRILAAQLSEPPPQLSAHRPDLAPALVAVVMRCLEKHPPDRWPTVDALRTALDHPPEPVQARGATEGDLPASRARGLDAIASGRRGLPKRRVAGAAAVAVLALLLTFGVIRGRLTASRAAAPAALPLGIGILPVQAASPGGELDWLATGLATQLSSELTSVEGLEIRPNETIAGSVALRWSLDSVAAVRDVDYFVRATLSRAGRDSVGVALELIEGGIRSVRAGTVLGSLGAPNAVALLGRTVAERLRPMLGSHVNQRRLEAGTTNRRAYEMRRQADRYRLMARERIAERDVEGAERAIDSARALLIQSERLDPDWPAPPLARAALSGTRFLLSMQPGRTDTAAIRRRFDAAIAIVDTVIQRAPREALAFAQRGQLRWQRMILEGLRFTHTTATDSAQRDLERALALDSTLAQAAADLSQIHFEVHARFADAARYAEQAYRLDAFLEDAGQIISRLAQSNLELENDSTALYWCAEGVRRETANPAHIGCYLDVMAWGNGPAHADSAWKYFREFEKRIGTWNASAKPTYSLSVAAILARAGVPRDSVRRIVARTRRDMDTDPASRDLRVRLLPREAAVLFRLGDSLRAAELFTEFRGSDPLSAERLAQRRLLRAYVRRSPATS